MAGWIGQAVVLTIIALFCLMGFDGIYRRFKALTPGFRVGHNQAYGAPYQRMVLARRREADPATDQLNESRHRVKSLRKIKTISLII
jgi:hypothetical protein